MPGCTQREWTAKSVRYVSTGTRSRFLRRIRPSTSDASGYVDTIASGRNSLMTGLSLRRVSQVSSITAGARSRGDSL